MKNGLSQIKIVNVYLMLTVFWMHHVIAVLMNASLKENHVVLSGWNLVYVQESVTVFLMMMNDAF